MTLSRSTYAPQLVGSDATTFLFDSTADGGARVSLNVGAVTNLGQRGTPLYLHQVPGAIFVGVVMDRCVVSIPFTIESSDPLKIAQRLNQLDACISGLGNRVRFYLHRNGSTDLWYWDQCLARLEGVEVPSIGTLNRPVCSSVPNAP